MDWNIEHELLSLWTTCFSYNWLFNPHRYVGATIVCALCESCVLCGVCNCYSVRSVCLLCSVQGREYVSLLALPRRHHEEVSLHSILKRNATVNVLSIFSRVRMSLSWSIEHYYVYVTLTSSRNARNRSESSRLYMRQQQSSRWDWKVEAGTPLILFIILIFASNHERSTACVCAPVMGST